MALPHVALAAGIAVSTEDRRERERRRKEKRVKEKRGRERK